MHACLRMCLGERSIYTNHAAAVYALFSLVYNRTSALLLAVISTYYLKIVHTG